MGKYIRKPKTMGDVAVRDVSQSSLGVRTRAKTLALKRLQSSLASVDASQQPHKPEYLELRSRRLEKPPLVRQQLQNSRKSHAAKQGFVCRDKEGPQVESSPRSRALGRVFLSVRPRKGMDAMKGKPEVLRLGIRKLRPL
ncbi:Cyclin-dependent kinase inhibitor 5 [Sesamum angolense]|uniref:Cyclin-dependent kinase inhibitor 5 n=1 Tax=Sesamum angolense TaxID=2727404 RepID=A0AAE1X8Q1_9LAMI|nr:Cyclin-dependent kinase inhibitor 5 [Sesamum angolense]